MTLGSTVKVAVPVHGVGYAGQGDIQIACTEDYDYADSYTPQPSVYMTQKGLAYTFEAALVTCEACKTKLRKWGKLK